MTHVLTVIKSGKYFIIGPPSENKCFSSDFWLKCVLGKAGDLDTKLIYSSMTPTAMAYIPDVDANYGAEGISQYLE
jgi:hypothetical protein